VEPVAVLKGHTGGVVSLAWSPDGQTLVSVSLSDRTLRLWAASSEALAARDRAVRQVSVKMDAPLQVQFLASGRLLMALESGRLRHLVLLSERAPDGSWTRTEAEYELGHRELLRAFVTTPVGTISCGNSTTLRLHSPTGVELASYDTHQVECYNVAASATGQYVAAAAWSADVNVLELDAAKGKAPRFVAAFALPGHRRAVRAIAFAGESKVVTASEDGAAQILLLSCSLSHSQAPLVCTVFVGEARIPFSLPR
jgi:WD40 repeat protein